MDIEAPEFDHTNYPIVPGQICLRRNWRYMPVRRRTEGLNSYGQSVENELYQDIIDLDKYNEENLADENVRNVIPRVIRQCGLLMWLNRAYIPLYRPQRDIRQVITDRRINSFSDRKCHELFGFIKQHLRIIFNLLRLPMFSYVGIFR